LLNRVAEGSNAAFLCLLLRNMDILIAQVGSWLW
jgi:hypothetical protein